MRVPTLPFEYRTKWRTIARNVLSAQDRRILDQRDRELEDFLGTLKRSIGTVAAAGARFQIGGDQQFSGAEDNVSFVPFPVAYSAGWDDYFVVDPDVGDNNYIRIITPGFYTATATVHCIEGSDFTTRVTGSDAFASGFSELDGYSGSVLIDGGNSASTTFASWAMDVDYAWQLAVKGVLDDSFFGFITIEYVAPFGGHVTDSCS